MTVFQTDTTTTDSILQRIGGLIQFVGAEPEIVANKVVSAIGILAGAWVVWWLALRLTGRYERRLTGEADETLEQSAQRARTVVQLINSSLRVAIGLTAILLLLNLMIPIGLLGVGVFGLALSFGAQSLVKDIISGFFILAENQFSVGDVVRIDGTAGAVERITLRVVMLRDVEGVLHIFPNGTITRVSNLTRGWARVVLDVSVAYKENVDRVMEVLREVVAAFHADPDWKPRLLEAPNVVGVQQLGDSAVNIRIMVDVLPGKQWETRRELQRRIKARFDEVGIEIPFPQRTVHMR